MKLAFGIFGQRILDFELGVRQVAHAWFSLPWMSAYVAVKNVRDREAPIFRACMGADLAGVRGLLESGEASIYDIDSEGCGLLGVSRDS